VLVASLDERDEKAGAELGDVVARLRRHGVAAEASAAPRREATVAEDLVAIANRARADLLVVGAYGHSRLQEWSFGGVTADLLDSCPKYVLFGR
jgi:nucleotide-binding universal stress UspA family protein